MRRLPLFVALTSLLLVLSGSPPAAAAGCRPLEAVVYAQTDHVRIAQRLGLNESPCAEYWVSISPRDTDKTAPRPPTPATAPPFAAQVRAAGPRIHAMFEINIGAATGWGAWVAADPTRTWYAAGVEARVRMAANGFDVASGDTWAVNEVDAETPRQNILDLVQGLRDGAPGMAPSAGVVFAKVPLQHHDPAITTAQYKAQLQAWFQDTHFWTELAKYVRFWGQETYADSRDAMVAGSALADRVSYLNDYFRHGGALASAAPDGAGAARSFLAGAYTPLGNAAWHYTAGYGYTEISTTQMKNFVSTETYALRSSGASSGSDRDRFGFAWSPKNSSPPSPTFAADLNGIADRLAAAIHDSDADPLGACAAALVWCDSSVDGAAFNDDWKLFTQWSPPTNTPAGTAVRVQVTPQLAVTFPSVSASGGTTATASSTGVAPPLGFVQPPGASFYDLKTTAAFTGPIGVCVTYGGADYRGSTPRLFAFADGAWHDSTTSLDAKAQTVCGETASAAQLAVFGAPLPTLSLPDPIVAPGVDALGAAVTYTATAHSAFDPAPVASCAPESGAVFPYGLTHVACTARDSAGGTATGSFDVTVLDTTPPAITAHVDGARGDGDWFTGDVRIRWEVTDGDSAITSPQCAETSIATDTAGTTLMCTATSGGGTATKSVEIKRDATPPTVVLTPARDADHAGWYNHTLGYSASGTDATSGIASCSPDAIYDGPDSASASVSGTCTDGAGNSESAALGFRFDASAPVVAVALDRSPDRNGWFNHPVGYSTHGADGTSGIESCSADGSFGGADSATAFVLGSCTNRAGVGTTATAALQYDATGPTAVTTTLVRGPDSNGWFNHAVDYATAGSDATSGIDACTSGTYTAPDSAAVTVGGGCTDVAGNSTAAAPVGLKLDTTRPAVSAARLPGSAPNANGWNNADVGVRFAVADALSGVAAPFLDVLVSTEGENQSVERSFTDLAGNAAVGSLGGISIDRTAPVLTVPASVTVNATSLAGAAVTYAATATDTSDPAPTTACTPGSDTVFAIGTAAVSCTATDRAGNRAAATFPVKVKGVTEQLQDLAGEILNLTALPPAVKTAILARLNASIAQLDPRNPATVRVTCASLGWLIALGPSPAIVADATRIRAVLAC